jgi:hypothetical protein
MDYISVDRQISQPRQMEYVSVSGMAKNDGGGVEKNRITRRPQFSN